MCFTRHHLLNIQSICSLSIVGFSSQDRLELYLTTSINSVIPGSYIAIMKCSKRIVLFTLFAMNLVDQPTPEVTIEQGTLSGKISADGSYFEYVGIPYATTNSSTRFQVSVIENKL